MSNEKRKAVADLTESLKSLSLLESELMNREVRPKLFELSSMSNQNFPDALSAHFSVIRQLIKDALKNLEEESN